MELCLQLSEFSIKVGLHQEPTLSPYLFVLVMDELTKHIQDDVPQCLQFANETKNGVNGKLEIWWYNAVCIS